MSRANRWLLLACLLLLAVSAWMFFQPGTPPGSDSRPAATTPAIPAQKFGTNNPATSAAAKPVWTRPAAREGVDAANIYARAFVLLDELTEEERNLLEKKPSEIDPETAKALFEKLKPIMALLHEAAKADFCDWGMDKSFDAPMTHMLKCSRLGKAAQWNASYRFPGEPDAAVADLASMTTLGHNSSDLLIGTLMNSAMARMANSTIKENTAWLNDSAHASALHLIQSERVLEDAQGGIRSEAAFSANSLRKILSMDAGDRQKTVDSFDPGVFAKNDSELARTRELFGNPVAVEAEIRFIQDTLNQMAERLSVPEPEFQAWRKALDQTLAADHPLAKIMMPGLDGIYERIQIQRVEASMLEAGLNVMRNGTGNSSAYRDPSTGQPFQYVPDAKGFELRSTLQYDGRPVTMRFESPRSR